MPKQYSFFDFLQQKHPTYKNLWMELLTTLRNNQYMKVNELGYIFWFKNNLCLILSPKTFSTYNYNEGKESFQYFQSSKKKLALKQMNDHKQQHFINLFETFIHSHFKPVPGHYSSVKLKIQPLGQLSIIGKTFSYQNRKIKWILNQNKNYIQRLPKLLKKSNEELKNMKENDNLNQMQRKFSLSLKKQYPLKPSLKRISSAKNLLDQSQSKNKQRQVFSKQFFKDLHFNSKSKGYLNLSKNLQPAQRQNRILKLKTEVEERTFLKPSQSKILQKIVRKIKCKTQQNQLINKEQNLIDFSGNKLKKSSSCFQLNKISDSFKQPKLTQGFKSTIEQLQKNIQSLQKNQKLKNIKKITPDKLRSNQRPKIKTIQSKGLFLQKINKFPNKLKLQIKLNKDNIKQQSSVQILRSEQSKSLKRMERTQRIQTEFSKFSQELTQNQQKLNLDKNYNFYTEKSNEQKSISPKQNNIELKELQQKEYENRFLRKALSKDRLSLQQIQKRKVKSKKIKKFILQQKSEDLMSQLYKEYPSQTESINRMIQEFQQIWQEKSRLQQNTWSSHFEFNQYFDTSLDEKIQIYQKKNKRLQVSSTSTNKKQIDVKKKVTEIEKIFKQYKDFGESETLNQKNVSFIQFKSIYQQQLIKKAFKFIKQLQKNFIKISPSHLNEIQTLLNQIDHNSNRNFKEERNLLVLNLEQFYIENKKLLCQIQQIVKQSFQQSNQKQTEESSNIQNIGIGPQIGLKLRQIYFILQSNLKQVGSFFNSDEKRSELIEFYVKVGQFQQDDQIIRKQINFLKNLLSEIQKKIEVYYKPLKIQQWEKKVNSQILGMFEKILKNGFESEEYKKREQFYLQNVNFIFQPRCYRICSEMLTSIKSLDEIYESSILTGEQKFRIKNLVIDINEAKNKLYEKVRMTLIDVQNSYQQLLCNFIMDVEKHLRLYVQIKPEMLFEQNYILFKNKYIEQISHLEQLFLFLLDRKMIYLNYKPRTLSQIFKNITQKKLQIKSFLQNLDSRMKIYRKDMQVQITDIEKVDKNLKDTLKQLSNKLKFFISQIKDQKQILTNQNKIFTLNQKFQKYTKEKLELIKRMQKNQIIYWEDDTYFQTHIKALLTSLQFVKSDYFKIVFQSGIGQITWELFNQFFKSYTQFIKLISQTRIMKIFQTNYDIFVQNLNFIEVILYKNYTTQDQQQMSKYEIKLNKKESSNAKLTVFLKKIAQLNKKQQYQILNIFRKAKQYDFYKNKKQKLLEISLTFQEIIHSQNFLQNCKIYKIVNLNQVFEKVSMICSQDGDKFLVNIHRFNQLSKQLFYFKKALFYFNSISAEQKENIYMKHFNNYNIVLSLLQSQLRLDISSNRLYSAFENIYNQREEFSQKFFIQKVRFFPRLSLLDWYSLIDCFSWENCDQILKNTQSLFSEIDEVILDKEKKCIKKLRIGYDFLEFQKQVQINFSNGIDFLKYFYTFVQGLVEDSFVDSIRRTCHIKLVMWHIYLTQQIECAFLTKNTIRDIRHKIQSVIKQFGEQLRYDIYQHHKNYEITQLKFFIDYLIKLQQISDIENSYLWKSTIKIYEKNKKVFIRQFQYQYDFGYEPQKATPFEPQFKIQRQTMFGSEEKINSFKKSSSITARPFVLLDLKNLTLKHKIYKLLDIIFKYNFFVIINYQKVIEQKLDLFRDEIIQNEIENQNTYFLLQIKQNGPKKNKTRRNLHLINSFYKELLYFSDYKEELQGINEVNLPILIEYSDLKDIPHNFRSYSKSYDFPSRIFSIELIILIELNKYQEFFSKYGISLGKMSLIFKYLNEQFSISYEKIIKIVNQFDQFMIILTEQGGVQKLIRKNINETLPQQNQYKLNYLTPMVLNRKNIPEQEMQKTPTFVFPNQTSKFHQVNQTINDFKKQYTNIQSRIITVISKQLFQILIHYYPAREVQISQVIEYLRNDSKKLKEVNDQVSKAVQNLIKGGKNVIVYGNMSEKTTLIKKHLKYGKNQIYCNDDQDISKKIEIYYLEGYENYLQLKKTSHKFVVQMQSLHQITSADITQNLVYIHPPCQKDIEQRFMEKIRQIFSLSNYKGYFPQNFQSDCWKSFKDLYEIYSLCGGLSSLVSKADIFFNILEKQLFVSFQQRGNKKTDSKILLKQIITIVIEIFIYSIESYDRKKFIIQSKEKKYFNLNELKGVNVEDLHNFTSVNLETQKIQQLVKRQRFPFKNYFPIDREIALIRKYYLLEKKYTHYFENPSDEIQQHIQNEHTKNIQIQMLKNFNFFFITQNYIIDNTIQKFFLQEFGSQFTHYKKYVPHPKLIQKCMRSISEKKKMSLFEDYSKKSRTLCMIEDVHMALPAEQTMIKILIDHFTELQKQKFFVFFMEKDRRRNRKSEKYQKMAFQYRPCLVFNIGQYSIESIFKYQVKNGVHQNVIEKTRKIRNDSQNDILKDDVDFLKFVLDCKVKLPSQLYEKYYLNSLLLSALNCTPTFEDSNNGKNILSQLSSQRSQQELIKEKNFDLKVKNIISSIEKTLDTVNKQTVFIKKKTYIQVAQVEIIKALDRFNKYFDIDQAEKIDSFFYSFQQKSGNLANLGNDKKQKFLKAFNPLQSYLIKSHLSKYLHLVMSQQRTYVIEQQITILPYLITFFHQQRLYSLSQEQNFFSKFIEIVQIQMKIAKEKQLNLQQSRQNFIILVKPPLATSQVFTYFLSLVIKKVSFLNFHKEFEKFLTYEKQKAGLIFNIPSLYQTKVKNFYDVVFENCKFIISVKECHKKLLAQNLQDWDEVQKQRKTIISETKRSYEQKQKNKQKRSGQRESVVSRQTSLRKEVNFVENKIRNDENKVKCARKLSSQFWKNLVYVNVSMNNEQKLQLTQQLLKKYFLQFLRMQIQDKDKDKDQQSNINIKSWDKIQRQTTKDSSQEQLKNNKLYKRLKDKTINILEKTLSKFDLSINQIERSIKQIIQQIIIMFKNKKRSSFNFLNDQTIKIPENIYHIKKQINQKISCLKVQILSKQNFINYLLTSLKKYSQPLKQEQYKWMNKEIVDLAINGQVRKQDSYKNLPLRQIKQKTFYHTNSLQIEKLKKQFYSFNLQELEQLFQKNRSISLNCKKEIFTNENQQESNQPYQNVFLFRKLMESFKSNEDKQLLKKHIDQSFDFIEDKPVPIRFQFGLIKLLHKQRMKFSSPQIKIQQKISIKDNMVQTGQDEEKKQIFEKQKVNKQSLQKSKPSRLSIKKNRESITSINQIPKLKLKLDYQQKGSNKNIEKRSCKKIPSVNIIDKDTEFYLSGKQIQKSDQIIQTQCNVKKNSILQMNEIEFINISDKVRILDLVFKRYFNFIVQLYQKYQFQQQEQNNSEVQKEKSQQFIKNVRKAEYFLILDMLTIHKKQRDSVRISLQQQNNQLKTLDKYIDVCSKLKDQTGLLGDLQSTLQSFQLPLYLRIELYQKIYLNTLSNINSNYQLNKTIRQVLGIEGEKGLLPQFLLTSNKNMEFPQTERIQLRTLQERNKLIIADPYNKFVHLVSEINGQIFYIEEFNQKQLRKIRFKLSFYVIYLQTVDDYFQKRELIQKVQKLIDQKSTDTKQSNQKLCLLVPSKNLLDNIYINEPEYIPLHLSFTYIKFIDGLNYKQQSLCKNQIKDLLASYKGVLNYLKEFSSQLQKYSVQQQQLILKRLAQTENTLIKKLESINIEIQHINSDKTQNKKEQGKYQLIHQYLIQLIEEQLIPYRYFKRVESKINWDKLQQHLIRQKNAQNLQFSLQMQYHNKKSSNNKDSSNKEIKYLLAKQLFSLKTQFFIDQFRECIQMSNIVIIVYDILPQKVFKDIKSVSEQLRKEFFFCFDFQKLQKKDIFVEINLLQGIDEQSLQKNRMITKINNHSTSKVSNSQKTINNSQRKPTRSFGKKDTLRRRLEEESNKLNDDLRKKSIYFVHEKYFSKIKNVIHLCEIIWV